MRALLRSLGHWAGVERVSHGIAMICKQCCVSRGDSTKFHSTEHSIFGSTHSGFFAQGNARFSCVVFCERQRLIRDCGLRFTNRLSVDSSSRLGPLIHVGCHDGDVVERDARSILQRYPFVVMVVHLAAVRKHCTFMENMR